MVLRKLNIIYFSYYFHNISASILELIFITFPDVYLHFDSVHARKNLNITFRLILANVSAVYNLAIKYFVLLTFVGIRIKTVHRILLL